MTAAHPIAGSEMFHHILIPTDLSDRTIGTVDMARDVVRGARARITLFHVIETLSGADFKEFEAFYRELDDRAAKHLSSLASRLAGSDLTLATTTVYGRPAEEIVTFAVDNQVDLIMLASHKVDPSAPGRGWGTLSHKIGVLAPCAVLLVK
ncbi:MAG: universal stress protein [Vicinamibacterales bacterium]